MSYRVTDVEYLKEYLKYATMFEKNFYIWSQAMNEANDRKRSIYNRKRYLQENFNKTQNRLSSFNVNETISRFEKESQKYRKIAKIAWIILVINVIFSVLITVFSACMSMEVSLSYFFSNIYGVLYLLIFVLLGLFVGFIGSIIGPICLYVYSKNKKKANQYEKEAKAQTKFNHSMVLESEVNHYQKEIGANSAEEKYITERQNEICRALNMARDNLNRLYSENILPAKYRSFNAVATMYEYLETGRCNTIQGHGGIYDTYEKDLQMGLVIRNLENINASLSRIEANQHLLYNELRQANSTLQTINSSLGDIKRTNAQIAHNSAISAEANRQTAAAAQWFTWRAWARGF